MQLKTENDIHHNKDSREQSSELGQQAYNLGK